MNFSHLVERFKAFEKSRTGKWTARLFSGLFTLAIAAYLVYRLSLIGWDKVWRSLPHSPWFYFLLLVMFFTLPVFEVLIYRITWKVQVKPWELFLALLNKRVLDKDVLGYSGEMYLYLWARKEVKKPGKEILHIVKDNVILSSVASTLVALVLLTIFFALGRVALPRQWAHPQMVHVVVVVVCVALLGGLVFRFRKRIFFLKRKEILKIFGLHICRLLVVQVLQVVQWAVVLPEIPLLNWVTLLAAQIMITRIPLLPSRDLIFMGTGLEISRWISVSTSSLAGMLLASSVINKVLNLIFFLAVFLTTRWRRLHGNGPLGTKD